ncbi:hypothetical protein BDR26DRAFT_913771 [Obelidium mucronatum]|nr:hypothetical protein BDR26DRAFT_913771 [Obelidium mucronatum]
MPEILSMFVSSLKPSLAKLLEGFGISIKQTKPQVTSSQLLKSRPKQEGKKKAPENEELVLLSLYEKHRAKFSLPSSPVYTPDFFATQFPVIKTVLGEMCRQRDGGKKKFRITPGDFVKFLNYGDKLWDFCGRIGFEADQKRVKGLFKDWRRRLAIKSNVANTVEATQLGTEMIQKELPAGNKSPPQSKGKGESKKAKHLESKLNAL